MRDSTSQQKLLIPLTRQLCEPQQIDHLGQHQDMRLILALSTDVEADLLLESFQTQHLVNCSHNKLAINHRRLPLCWEGSKEMMFISTNVLLEERLKYVCDPNKYLNFVLVF